ncbi:MAG: PaaI family thioesterase [Bacteroidales bacterium]|nr:PaaI family thioesterase [Bacteroidales bacterium]
MRTKAFQDYYPDDLAHCYGCGKLNDHGHSLKTYWDKEETVSIFKPEPFHTAVPGYVYGGLIASLIDCHCTGTAAAAKYREEKRTMDTFPAIRFLTASLKIDYLKPTPIETELEIRATIKEIKGRKVTVSARLLANREICAQGEVITVQMPEGMVLSKTK